MVREAIPLDGARRAAFYMEIFYILLILLGLTRLCGDLALRIGQPPLVGELIAGVALGLVVRGYPETFPVLANLHDNSVFLAITDLGIFFLMLLGGLELRPRDLTQASGRSAIVAASAMLLPLGLGLSIGWFFLPGSNLRLAQAMFLGTAMAITAVPVAIRALMDLGLLDTTPGRMIVSAAVFDDVLSLILLAILTGVIRTGGMPEYADILMLLLKTIGFFALTTTVGWFLLPWLARHLARIGRLDELEFSFLVLIALGYAYLAEMLGLHFILGAFVAGLFFRRRTIAPETYEDVKGKVSGITTGFLAPIFFASIGLHLDLSAVTAVPLFIFILVVIAFVSKLVGAALPARVTGLSWTDATIVGVAMSGRGAVELVIADIALRAGLFDRPRPVPPVVEHMFSTIVLVAIVTTLMTPIVLRLVLSRRGRPTSDKEDSVETS